MLMKKNKNFDTMPIHVKGIILETPKGQFELISLNQYGRAD
jgi:hypothetical protein